MKNPIATAMIFAAGFGTRLKPITDTVPKPLVKVRGKALLDYILDRVKGLSLIVNTHYLAHEIDAHLARTGISKIKIIHEPEILETGGGIKNALPFLGNDPIFVINSDSLWLDGATPALQRLQDTWDAAKMDVLLLLYPQAKMAELAGDFFLEGGGKLERRGIAKSAPYIFMGVQILKPELAGEIGKNKFSLNEVYDRAIERGRLFGLVHDNLWFHISTPQDIENTERFFKSSPAAAQT